MSSTANPLSQAQRQLAGTWQAIRFREDWWRLLYHTHTGAVFRIGGSRDQIDASVLELLGYMPAGVTTAFTREEEAHKQANPALSIDLGALDL